MEPVRDVKSSVWYKLRLTTPTGQWTAQHHRVASRFRLPSLFSRSACSEEQVISFAHIQQGDHNPGFYSLSRDRKLRLWDATNGSCLKTIEVRVALQDLVIYGSQTSTGQSSSALSDNTSVPLLRVVTNPSSTSRYSHLVVIFLATPHSPSSPGTFAVYRASPKNDLVAAGERSCSSIAAGSHLRGFEIIPPFQAEGIDSGWRLWVSWDLKGISFCESVLMNDLFQFQTYLESNRGSRLLHDWMPAYQTTEVEQLDAAYFDNLLRTESPTPSDPYDNTDILVVFISCLFQPGRFSSSTLTTALEEYIQQMPKCHLLPQLATAYPSLSKRFAAVVGCHLEMEMSTQTGAPVVDVFRRNLKRDWLGIWARVRDLDKQSRWPVSTAVIDERLVVLAGEGITVPIPEDTVGVVDRLGKSREAADQFMEFPERSLEVIHRALATPLSRKSTIAVSAAGRHMGSTLLFQDAQDGGTILDAFTAQLNIAVSAQASQPVELLAGFFWDDHVDPFLADEDRAAVRRHLSECPDLLTGIRESLDMLADPISPVIGASNLSLNHSGYANTLIASAISSVIAIRYTFVRHLVLVSLFFLSESADQEAEDLIEILARAMATYHRYHVLKWVATQSGEKTQMMSTKQESKRRLNGGDEMLAEGLGGLKMREKEDEGLDTDGYDARYSLIHSILSRRLPQTVREGSVSQISEAASSFLSAIGLLSKDQVEIEPQSTDVLFAYTVLIDGHPAFAGQLSDFYPAASGMAYVRGRAYIEMGMIGSAVKALEKAGAACKGTGIDKDWHPRLTLISHRRISQGCHSFNCR